MARDADGTIPHELVNLPSGEFDNEGGNDMSSDETLLYDHDNTMLNDSILSLDLSHTLADASSEKHLDTETLDTPPLVKKGRGGRLIKRPQRYDD